MAFAHSALSLSCVTAGLLLGQYLYTSALGFGLWIQVSDVAFGVWPIAEGENVAKLRVEFEIETC